MSFLWHDGLGTLGVALVVLAYLLLQIERLSSSGLTYSAMNGLGAFLILVSLTVEFNLSAFLMEAAWLLISIYGIVMVVRRRRSGRGDEP